MKGLSDFITPKNRWTAEINSSDWEARRKQYFRTARPHYCPGCRQDKPLQLHHINYDSSRHLWEYNDNELIPLCAECHRRYHDMFKASRVLFLQMPPAKLSELLGCLRVSLEKDGVEATVNRFRRMVENE